MGKNLWPKTILIIVLVAAAAWILYPPSKTLKPGIDLAGGISLIYQIDTEGLEDEETKDLAQRMITVLRKRIDPTNIQNLVWRPQGNTRFEIQMPLASAETRVKRQSFEEALAGLLEENVNAATVIGSFRKPADERAKDFEKFAHGDPNRLATLQNIATIYDERKELQDKRDQLEPHLKVTEAKLSASGLDLEKIEQRVSDWAKLDDPNRQESLKQFLGSEDKLDLLTDYVRTHTEWAKVLEQLTDPKSGKNVKYEEAQRDLDKLNLTQEQLSVVLDLPAKSPDRKLRIQQLQAEFPDRAEKIERVAATFDEYRPYRGRLDDPSDLRRMLKGAGILEFRILPTQGGADLTPDIIENYVASLKAKGPKYASDNKYMWCEVENVKEWIVVDEQGRAYVRVRDSQEQPATVAPFGNKYYVLASNRPNETILHSPGTKEWRLEKSEPTTDRMGRRAIGFKVDDRGGRLFFNVSGKNIGQPLCILLDGLAVSAPTIQTRLRTDNQITGSFTQTEVTDMVNKLNAGSLPARLIEQPISEVVIGPSIGADNRDRGIRAGFIGLLGVMACMLFYYTLAGSIADMALLMNLLFTLAIMAGLRATFTLPGIAGAILTIGMSVDANVLIFERIREEQQKGSSLRTAIKNGYERAFSAIFDSNLTTVISAAILYWVASEDIKGFAIVLMLGLASSMFTALFVTRVTFDWLASKRLIKERLFMLQLIRKPNINWMRFRPVFLAVSAVLTIGGLAIFFTRRDVENNKYDIEFTGGTSVQINLKEGVNLSRQQVEDRIHQAGLDLSNPALAAANVYSIGRTGRSYEITTTATNKTTATVTFPQSEGQTQYTVESITAAIIKAQAKFDRKLGNLTVIETGTNNPSFTISTSQISPTLVENVLASAFPNATISEAKVDEVVNDAIKTAFADALEILSNLEPEITSKEQVTRELADSHPELSGFLGGIKITCTIKRTATPQEIDQRFRALRFKPDTQSLSWYTYKIFGADAAPVEPNQPINSFAYVSTEPEAAFRQLSTEEWTQFEQNETAKVLAATTLETSLPRVTQISPSIGAEARTRALVAIVLSLSALLAYIWFRFGNLRYGLGAVATLFHDTCATVGAVTACTYIAKTIIGQTLLIADFKIDLAMIAAFLTLIGYSLNDTIVIYDRIRENRRKGTLTPQIISNSINDTLSRTLLTGLTTLLVVLIMYIFGGPKLRGFNFALIFGLIVGTYSSIAISAPVLLLGVKASSSKTR
jgi:SecD/SecF fusion protein